MGQNDSSDKEQDSFFSAIEDAVDNLFTQYEGVPADETEGKSVDSESSLEFEGSEELDKALGMASDLLDEFNQALLTIDWEISQTNIDKALGILTQISDELQLEADSPLLKLLDLMQKMLKAVADSPETISTSAPKALRDGLSILSNTVQQGANLDSTSISLIDSACEELKDSLPGPVSTKKPAAARPSAKKKPASGEISLSMEKKEAKTKTVPAPTGLLKILLANLAVLEQCIHRLGPVESLFSKKPGHAKILIIYQKLRESLTKQKKVISTALESEYHSAPSDADIPVPKKLEANIRSHLSVLEQCKNHILPLENLFSKKTKFQKLHTIHLKIRTQLEGQIDAIFRALQGDYKPAAIIKTAPPPPAECSCPWPSLRIGQWRNKTVAFIVGHIAYEKTANSWTKNNLGMLAVFPLKKLKPIWPWSKLRPRLSGSLAELTEAELKQLTLPVLNHPDPVQQIAGSTAGATLIILYDQSKGGVILLDQPTVDTAVQEKWRWQPSKRADSIISGTLKTEDENIPVIDLNNL